MTEYKVKVYSTHTEWFNLEGKLHRENGPAIEFANGDKSWWINGKNYSEKEFNDYIESKKNKCPEYILNYEEL